MYTVKIKLSGKFDIEKIFKACKANSTTYYNLFDSDKKYFRKQYTHLKKTLQNKKVFTWEVEKIKKALLKYDNTNHSYNNKVELINFINSI